MEPQGEHVSCTLVYWIGRGHFSPNDLALSLGRFSGKLRNYWTLWHPEVFHADWSFSLQCFTKLLSFTLLLSPSLESWPEHQFISLRHFRDINQKEGHIQTSLLKERAHRGTHSSQVASPFKLQHVSLGTPRKVFPTLGSWLARLRAWWDTFRSNDELCCPPRSPFLRTTWARRLMILS